MKSSTAYVQTANASRYLQQLCKHWSHRFTVDFTPEEGSIDFGDGEGTVELAASPTQLRVQVSIEDSGDLPGLERVVAEHLARFGFREELIFDWQPG